MRIPAAFRKEFSDHHLFPAFEKWVKRTESNSALSEPLLVAFWRAFLAGSEAYKALPVDTLELQKRLAEQDQIALIWSVDDVIDTCKDAFGITLSEEHAREVLFTAEKRHDANEGINWLVLQTHANMSDFFEEYVKEDDDEEEDEDEDD